MSMFHVKPSDWRTRGWSLVRRCIVNGTITPTNRRLAALLLGQAPAKLGYHAELKIRLEEIAYGGPPWDDNAPEGYRYRATDTRMGPER